jgi:hypothetical protein
MIPPLIGLVVVVFAVIIYLALQIGKKTRDKGNAKEREPDSQDAGTLK